MRQISHFAIGACLIVLSACGDTSVILSPASEQTTSNNQLQEESVERPVNFDIQFSSFFDDASDAENGLSDVKQVLALAPPNMQGSVVAENIFTGEITTSPIIVYLENGVADSQSTLHFKPGEYDLTFSFNKEGEFYIGQQFIQVFENNLSTVPVFVSPVIGDTTIDIQHDTLIDLEFNIALDDINSANLTDPILEVSLNGNTDAFLINTDSGLSQRLWLSVPAGDHSISVTLFDAGLIVGQSQIENITIAGDDSVIIDIAPLYGQVKYDLFVDGGSANVEVNIPAAVVDTVGGLSNLDSFLQVAASDGSNFFSEPLILVPDANDYKASLTLNDVSYGLQTFEVIFFNKTDGNFIGSCFEEEALATSDVTISCQIQLQQESLISTSLLSTVAVNVFDNLGFPVPGATVSVDGNAVGVTGDDANLTPGYTTAFVKPGTHTIRADLGGEYGEVEYVSEALNSANVTIILGQTVNSNPPLFDENFLQDPAQGIFPDNNFWYTCASPFGVPEAVIEVEFSRLALPSYNNGSDCSINSVVTQQNFTQAEIEVAGGFEVLLELTGAPVAGVELSVGIGEDAVGDPVSFTPSDSADAVVTIRDSELEINIYEAGSAIQTFTRPLPFTVDRIETVLVDVELATQLPGEPGNLYVTINGNPNFIEPVPFIWDGGGNHIELRGSSGPGAGPTVKVYVDRITVRPR